MTTKELWKKYGSDDWDRCADGLTKASLVGELDLSNEVGVFTAIAVTFQIGFNAGVAAAEKELKSLALSNAN